MIPKIDGVISPLEMSDKINVLTDAQNSGGGGGVDAQGRIVMIGTEEDPININYINEPNSYVLSGVFDLDGLPPDIVDLIGFLDATLCMDVSIKVGEWDEERGYTYYIVTKSIDFVSLTALSPVSYSNLFNMQVYEAPLTPQEEEDLIDDGYIKVDDITYIQFLYEDWFSVNLSAVPERILLLMRDNEGDAMNLDQLLVYQGENEETDETPEYSILFFAPFKNSDFVEDLIFTTDSDQYKLYPHYRLSTFISMANVQANIKVIQDVGREPLLDGYAFKMGSVEFPNKALRDAWMVQFSTWYVYVSYTTNVGKPE